LIEIGKTRTADEATSAIRGQKTGFNESVIDFLWSVNDDSVKDTDTLIEIIKKRISEGGLTEEIEAYLIGRVYELIKSEAVMAGSRRNKKGHKQSNSKYPCSRTGKYREIADYAGEPFGMHGATVRKHSLYKKGIDAIRSVNEELAESILKSERFVRRVDVMEIGNADRDVRESMINAVILGKPTNRTLAIKRTKRKKQDLRKIAECVSSLYGATDNEYRIDSLLQDIRMNSEPFINMLGQTIAQNEALCREHKAEVISTITETIINKINEFEEVIKKL